MGRVKNFIDLYSSCMIKRDPNMYVFGAWFGNKYSDNSKFLFQHFVKRGRNAVWITKSEDVFRKLKNDNLPVYMADTKEGIYYCRHAKYAFFSVGIDDLSAYNLGGAILINLWHGIPLKKIGYDNTYNTEKQSILLKIADILTRLPLSNRYVVSSSDSITNIYMSAFKIKKSHILQFGQPRNDCFFDYSIKKYSFDEKKYRRVVLYLPTHRNEGKVNIHIDKIFDLERLNSFCREHELLFVIKKHYYHIAENNISTQYSNIIEITHADYDTQALLYTSDILVTDYSSCYIDYLLLDRPVLFYAYDYDDYLRNDRDFYQYYYDITAGPTSTNFDEFLLHLENALNCNDYLLQAKKAKDFFYDKKNQGIVGDRFLQELPQ